MSESRRSREYVINCDASSPLDDLARTDRTEADAVRHLVLPVAESGLTAIDWNVGTTGRHNCRTPHRLEYTDEERAFNVRATLQKRAEAADREVPDLEERIATWTERKHGYARTVRHYNAQERDLLDIVIHHGHLHGLKVFAGVRLNHANSPLFMREVPGPDHCDGMRKDFRSEQFHDYHLVIYESLLERGLDGLMLDFERKAPFFPDGTPQDERFDACRSFVRKVRALGPDFLAARVAYEEPKGALQGQDPLGWMEEGLLDAVIPATHNHEPDLLDWSIERFVDGAGRSPRDCLVWPQIWPTAEQWTHPGFPDDYPERWHSAEAVRGRVDDLLGQGADGVYFFNFYPWTEEGKIHQRSVQALMDLP